MVDLAHAFEWKPLLVAGAIGAIVLAVLSGLAVAATPTTYEPDVTQSLWRGAVVGMGVQVGVRLLGVS